MKDTTKRTKGPIPEADSSPIRQLADRVGGNKRVAELIGCSDGHVSEMILRGTARVAFVKAAQYEISKMDRQANSAAIAVLSIPASQRAAFDAIAKGLGLDVKYVIQ